ncbi:HugZ family pyridoxamine 5'-phosphate oxidase [Rhodoblastus sp.]|uniref:HugZ family pyridoxamine 5'-phosphate oxidase n=1 Tax=Rhodoblastus sp. TaxID=1962975 RepID=UPI003F994861
MNDPDDAPQGPFTPPFTPPFAPLPQNTFDGLELAKKLLRSIPSAALATLTRETSFPFATLTSVATDDDGAPILLLSDLAHHTRNLRADPRGSLLLSQGGKGDPLAHPRLTIVGRLAPAADARAKARFLRRHPKSALYAGFADFSFWRLEPEAAHLNGGFARAADYPGADLLTRVDDAKKLLAEEEALLDEINALPRAARGALARAAGEDSSLNWRATGLDPDGLDLAAPQMTARLVFGRRAEHPAAWREALEEARRNVPAPG